MYLDFDAEKHRYTLTDGITDEALPSVTQILSAEGFIISHNNNSDWHMEKGRFVHSMIELHLKGVLDEDTLDPFLRPSLEAFRQFQVATGFSVQGFETPLYYPHQYYMYAGTPDMWGTLNGVQTLVDVKSGGPAKWHVLQLAAYHELLRINGHEIKQAANLYLSNDGKYSLSKPLSARELRIFFQVFLCAVTTYKWKKENL